VNKFQHRLILPVLLSCFLGFSVCLLFLDYFYFDESSIIYDFSWVHLKLLAKWFVPLVTFSLVVIGGIVYSITMRILGPYERILRDLDEIIDGKPRRFLSVRKNDEMFSDLLKRINALIKKIPE